MSDANNPATPAAPAKSGAAATPAADRPAAAPGAAAPGSNPAQEAFGRYRTRLAAYPAATGWPTPPSAMMPGQMPRSAPHPLGSLSERLGGTVRLSVDLLNATLLGAANMISGMAAERRGYGYSCDCGCGRGWHDGRCGHDCCREMGVGCCSPGVRGCGCSWDCGCGHA
jgi:hypothetical protein